MKLLLHDTIVTGVHVLWLHVPPQVKAALLTWIQRDCAQRKGAGGLPSFLRNKLAQTLVAVLQVGRGACLVIPYCSIALFIVTSGGENFPAIHVLVSCLTSNTHDEAESVHLVFSSPPV